MTVMMLSYCLTVCWVDRLGDLRVGQGWWLRVDVIQDLLDYVWVSDPKAAPSDDACGATTQWAQANINTKDWFERFAIATLRPKLKVQQVYLVSWVLQVFCILCSPLFPSLFYRILFRSSEQ